MKRHGGGTGLVVTVVLLTGCGGGSDGAAAPTPTAAIATVEPSPTPAPPTLAPPTLKSEESPEPTATSQPTATPDPQADQDAAVIAAWERYLELSFAARGKDPSPEALDYDSYVTGGAKDGLLGAIEQDLADDLYLTGSVRSTDPTLLYNEVGDARITDCIDIDLASFSRGDDSPGLTEDREVVAEARLEPTGEDWLVAAYLTEGACVG